jgi:FtsP/CotA-like multicopper oxidase with cupredoxin domain
MFKIINTNGKLLGNLIFMVLVMVISTSVQAQIDGVTGTTFDLKTKAGYITTPDGDSLLVWGYALNDEPIQYPGPTLILDQGDTINITLTNTLSVPVSMIFPGQKQVFSLGGIAGQITKEAAPTNGTVQYSFVASKPGTFMYQSGTNQELQTEMGLFGAIIVRPPTANQAYNHPDTSYDYEYLFILSEMDPAVHHKVEMGQPVDNNNYKPVLWFLNGRNAPDTMADAGVPWLPNQPYNSLPRVHPGDVALMRFVTASRNSHPFHTHGNHFRLLARDGNLLASTNTSGADLSHENFTLHTVSGATYDATWDWTGKELGWDIYGHLPEDNIVCSPDAEGFDILTREWCANHNDPIPVITPELQDLAFGGFYSGSPYLGAAGSLPPGEGGLNLNGGLFFMWHSHNERELVNNDIFPGGMMTMMIVEPPGVPIP